MRLRKISLVFFQYFISSLIIAFFNAHQVNAGRMFDVTSLKMETVVTKAGSNLSLACPGVTEHSLVLVLEWYCKGCIVASQGSHYGPTGEVKLVEFRGESTTIWQNRERVNLNTETYGLDFHPVVAGDTGEYKCLVNNRPLPEAINKLVVQAVPEPPGRPLILAFTSRTVNLSWAPPHDSHNSRITHYIIYTRVGEDGEWDEVNGQITENNRTSYQITGLDPFTVYSFQIVGVNALGKSSASKESYYIVTLREAPDGKPTITAAQNASATSIRLAWRAPPRNTIHGEFLGYRLAYRPRDKGPDSIQELYIRDPNVDMYVIQGLMTFTQYLVSLQVFNPEGMGPPTTVAVITDEGVPSKPLNVSVRWVTESLMDLVWAPPSNPNGKLEGYRIFYMQKNFTDVVTVKPPPVNLTFTLKNLESFTEYRLWVKGFTWKNEGESSDVIVVKTDVGGPSPPRILNVSCQAQDALFIQWQKPTRAHASVDFYYVDYRRDDWAQFEQITMSAHLDQTEQSILLQNLTTNIVYEVRIRGGTRSILEPGKVYKGQFSDSKKMLMEPNCEKLRIYNLPRASDEFTPTMVFISVGASFLLLILLIILLVWRRCMSANYYYLNDPPRLPTIVGGTGWTGDVSEDMKQAIPAHLFLKHVQELHSDGDIGFSKEYEAIQTNSVSEEYSAQHSQHPDNKQKNRYLNIVAFDHTRVKLQPMPGQKKCVDYVNANFIDGYQKPRAYIGTQGPLPATFDSFWRMVWEHNVHIIVMITNLVERGREYSVKIPKLATQCLEKKCDMYWPKEGAEIYGVIQVKLVKEDVMATYTVRTLQIRHLKLKKKKKPSTIERIVYHYHYTNWPDHGVPSHPLPVLSFVKKSSMANPPDAGPIIVHCSAGVGRTGTYIAIDAMLRQIKARGDLNIFGFLHHIRAQRNFLVQTEEQYVFIHDALVEAIQSGETNLSRKYLCRYIHTLLSGSYADEKCEVTSLLEYQFKLVTQYSPKETQLSAALRACNLTKNRNLDLVCTDAYRVLVTPKAGLDGSEYINASFLPGYSRLHEFILTQHPLESTVVEFWEMVWDHNVGMMVLISGVDEEEFPVFWPSYGDSYEMDTFSVKLVQESDRVGYVLRDFTLHSLKDDYEMSLKLIQSSHWPYISSPSLSSLFDLITIVQDSTPPSYSGPLLVIDRFGGLEGATFCALTTSYKELEAEGHIDLYMYAKLYHEQRPGIWKSMDDYLFLYRCVESLMLHLKGNENNMSPGTSPSPLLPPIGLDSFLSSSLLSSHHPYPTSNNSTTTSTTNTNGISNGRMNGNGVIRVPPDGMESTLFHGNEPMV